MTGASSHRVAAVAIGRNEGERLIRCLGSLVGCVGHVVYVDSGSSDGSVETAKAMGVRTVALDMTQPFTAARARNRGVEELKSMGAPPEYVQFVDGDCEVDATWIERGASALDADSNLAVVCGRRRERFSDASKYNQLCDMEWDTPPGVVRSCGGDAMIRLKAFDQVSGYDPTLIAGEEPELCVRLRLEGWRVVRLDSEMTLHDAAMTRFEQWWRRAVRAGHAYAEGAAIHASGPFRHNVREVRSTLFWGAAVPGAAIGFTVAAVWQPIWVAGSGLIVLLFALQWGRIARGCRARGFAPEDARLYSTFCLIGKAAGAVGIARYWFNRLVGRRSRLIEYKRRGPQEAVTKPA